MRWLVLAGLLLAACTTHDVEVTDDTAGHALSRVEKDVIQEIADRTLREARGHLPTLPRRVTLRVDVSKNVIPETGENGTTIQPAEIVWTVDADRGIVAVARAQLRASLLHELHHLARERFQPSRTLMDRVVTEGMAIAFERDAAKVAPPWGKDGPELEAWTHELLQQPPDSPWSDWLHRHPDGRRWIGMRAGTRLVDRASRASGRAPAALVASPTEEILKLAGAAP